MNVVELAQPIVANYTKHGWTLRRVYCGQRLRMNGSKSRKRFLSRLDQFRSRRVVVCTGVASRPRAWELRLIADSLMRCLKLSKPKRLRKIAKDLRREMENKMRDYANL